MNPCRTTTETDEIDNKTWWGTKLGNLRELRFVTPLIAWYCSIEQTTVAVEQSLSLTKSLLEKHCGPMLDSGLTMDEMLLVVLGGPQKVDEICIRNKADEKSGLTQAAHGLTDLSRDWAGLWLRHHGRRFALYKQRSDAGVKRPEKPGSEVSVVNARRQSIKRMLDRSDRSDQANTVAGKKLGDLFPRLRRQHQPDKNDGLQKFRSYTKNQWTVNRSAFRTHSLTNMRPGGVFKPGQVCLEAQRQWNVVVNVADVPLSDVSQDKPKGSVVVMAWGCNDAVFDNRVDYVVVKNMRSDVLFASDAPPKRGTVQLALLVVALGCAVVQSNKWRELDLRRPHFPDVMMFQKSLGLTIARLMLTKRFRTVYPDLAASFHKLARADKSGKWTVEDEDHSKPDLSKPKPDYWHINGLSDVCGFLRKVRRIDNRDGAVFSKVSKATNGSASTLSDQPDQPKAAGVRPRPDHIKSIFTRASASQLGRSHMGPKRHRRLTVQKGAVAAFHFLPLLCFLLCFTSLL